MNQQTNKTRREVTPAPISIRLFPALAIWWIAILLLDYVPLTDVMYVRTLRIGLWVYLVELLLDCFRQNDRARSGAPSPATKAIAAANPPAHEFWIMSQRVALGLSWRVPALILGTCVVTVWCGYGPSAQLAAFFPTVVYAIARHRLGAPPQVETSPFIRGSQLKAQAYAESRADELNTLGPMELANRLGELNDFTTGDQTSP